MVYLTGSHIRNNSHDGLGPGADCAEVAERYNRFRGRLGYLAQFGVSKETV